MGDVCLQLRLRASRGFSFTVRVWLGIILCRLSVSRGTPEPLKVVVMNDHASALGVWLETLPTGGPPGAVLHIDRHSDLASPRSCKVNEIHKNYSAWASCVDRAGFQLAAAWLGLIDRVWWVAPGLPETESLEEIVAVQKSGRLTLRPKGSSHSAVGVVQRVLATQSGSLPGLHSAVTSPQQDFGFKDQPLLLDIDLDFWGGGAGPLQPPWEAPRLQTCGEVLREHGAASWGSSRSPVTHFWPYLLDGLRQDAESVQYSNVTSMRLCQEQLATYSRSTSQDDLEQLYRARDFGLSLPEALLAQAAGLDEAAVDCGVVDEDQLVSSFEALTPAVVTISRSVDGFLPFRCTLYLEATMLRVLHRAFNRSFQVDYLPGVAPLPALQAMYRSSV